MSDDFEQKLPKSEAIISNLLQEAKLSGKNGPLISEVTPSSDEVRKPTQETEEPTMMELMMAAQREAKAQLEQEKQQEQKVTAKIGFSGFKKGFFGNSTSKPHPAKPASSASKSNSVATSSQPPSSVSASAAKPKAEDGIIEVKAPAKGGSSTAKGMVLDDVQQALEAEKHPMLKQLESKEWVTDSLMNKVKGNAILRNGMSHPKCMAAMQMMQKDPKAALNRFKDDVEVTRFLQEFGKIMADHFESLGAQRPTSSAQTLENTNIGPLQAKAMEKATAAPKSKIEEVDPEQERVNNILKNAEIRNLLMDASMQQVLMECGDPSKFREHMRNPDTAKKLHKLKEAGLVHVQL